MKLYLNPGACSLGPHIALHELSLGHDIEVVQIHKGETFTDDFLARNPLGMVPVLELDDGEHVTECIAIFHYLSGLKPEVGLFPEGHRFLELMSQISTELHKCFLSMFYGEQILPNHQEARGEMADFFATRLERRWGALDDRLAEQDWLHEDRFTAADVYLYVVMNWWKSLKRDFDSWPHLRRVHQRMVDRPAVQEAHRHEKLPVATR